MRRAAKQTKKFPPCKAERDFLTLHNGSNNRESKNNAHNRQHQCNDAAHKPGNCQTSQAIVVPLGNADRGKNQPNDREHNTQIPQEPCKNDRQDTEDHTYQTERRERLYGSRTLRNVRLLCVRLLRLPVVRLLRSLPVIGPIRISICCEATFSSDTCAAPQAGHYTYIYCISAPQLVQCFISILQLRFPYPYTCHSRQNQFFRMQYEKKRYRFSQ